MIQKIYSTPYFHSYIKNNRTMTKLQDFRNNDTDANDNIQGEIRGVPSSYITFKGSEDVINYSYTDDALKLIARAAKIAKENGNSEVTSFHILQAAIAETEDNLASTNEELINSGAIESISTLNTLINNYAKRNMIQDVADRTYLIEIIEMLKEDNKTYLDNLPKATNEQEKMQFSKSYQSVLTQIAKDLSAQNTQHIPGDDVSISAYAILGAALNTITYANIEYAGEFIKNLSSYSLYKPNKTINEDYMEAYDKRAIEVWNRLALGSSLFVTSSYDEEALRLMSSIVNTIDEDKYGNFNSENTDIYAMSDNVTPKELLDEISAVKESASDKTSIFLVDFDSLLTQCINANDGTLVYSPELLALGTLPDDKTKIIFFADNNIYYSTMQEAGVKKNFSNFLSYKIPPIHTYEALEIINKDKNLVKNIKTPFSKEAKEKAIFYSDKINGVFPDKAVDLMKRISEYYANKKKKINVKDVDEFAFIAHDLFSKDENNQNAIVYDTGKTLAKYYGKETTKKDIEAIVRQINTGRIGTQGMIIYSKDGEAGTGRKYTAQVIAGEAHVPFMEISTSDFATSVEDDSDGKITPAQSMMKLFADIKSAAKQNENKTAILFINNFEEFAFSGPYLPGYKQAMAQLIREMAKVEDEDVSILVIGSTDEYYVDAIPTVTRGFSQTIAVDTPAFNKQSRREVILHRLSEKNLPLAGKNKAEKEVLINKLVKLTEYMSYVEIKDLINKSEQIMYERNKKKASIGDFIEAYLQIQTGRTSHPEMPVYNKKATTSHECGHATNLEVMNQLYRDKGEPWFQSADVNFITLDPRGGFLGAVFEGRSENMDYPFEALFAGLVCSFGGYACEKLFFNMDGSSGISMDLAQATAAAKRGVEHFGFGYNTGKISAAGGIKSSEFTDNVYKDVDVLLTNAKIASDLITEGYKKFNEWFTNKYSKLIGTDECMIDGDDFRKMLLNWKKSQSADVKENLKIMEDMLLDIIKASKNGKKYYEMKKML